MKIKAGYRHHPYAFNEFYVPNFLTRVGGQTILAMSFAGDISDIPLGGNWFVGLTSEVNISRDATLGDLTGELSSQGGYTRLPIARAGVDWTIDTINGIARCLSKIITFTPSGADYSHPFTRSFLCNVGSGVAGNLYSISGPLPTPVLLTDGTPYPMQYEIYGEVD